MHIESSLQLFTFFGHGRYRRIYGNEGPLHAQLSPDGFEITLHGELPEGFYFLGFRLEENGFDWNTSMVELVTWPDNTPITTGPWDLDPINSRMGVPSFRLEVNGEDWGDIWAEMPDLRTQQKGEGHFEAGFRQPRTGSIHLRLAVIDSDRERFSFRSIKWGGLFEDERKALHVPWQPASGLLFFGEKTPRDLASVLQHPLGQFYIASMKKVFGNFPKYLEKYGPYKIRRYHLRNCAFLGLVLEDQQFIDLAIDGLRELLTRPSLSNSRSPRLMQGEDNDRDLSGKLVDICVIYSWLHSHLESDIKEAAFATARRYIEKMVRFYIRQRCYFGMPDFREHSLLSILGPLLSIHLFKEQLPQEPYRSYFGWLYNYYLQGLKHLPNDGFSDYSSFSVSALPIFRQAFGSYFGKDPLLGTPFFRNYAGAIQAMHDVEHFAALQPMNEDVRRINIQATADLAQGIDARRFYLRLLGESRRIFGEDLMIDFFEVLNADPALLELAEKHPEEWSEQAAAPGGIRDDVRSFDTGFVIGSSGDLSFSLYCGGNYPAKGNHRNSRQHRAVYVKDVGNFSIKVKNHYRVVPYLSQFKQEFSRGSQLSVNGEGYHAHGQWLAGNSYLHRPFLREITELPTVRAQKVVADLTPGYSRELGLHYVFRTVYVFKERELLVVLDEASTESPSLFSTGFLSCNWRQVGENHFCSGANPDHLIIPSPHQSSRNGELPELYLHCSSTYPARANLAVCPMVLPYIYGINNRVNTNDGVKADSMKTMEKPVVQRVTVETAGKQPRIGFASLFSFDPADRIELTSTGFVLQNSTKGSIAVLHADPAA